MTFAIWYPRSERTKNRANRRGETWATSESLYVAERALAIAVSLISVAKISNGKLYFRLVQKFHQADGDRISLLARGASRHPDPDRVSGGPILDQSGEHVRLQFLEDRWFPKECGDGDQTVLAQRVGFLAILLEMPAVVFQVRRIRGESCAA